MEQTITDPTLVNKLAAQAMTEQPATPIITNRPTTNIVELAAGVISETGEVYTEAEIRELTGDDEEALARVGDSGKALMTILNRGLVSIGGLKPTQTMLDALLAGDRDAILLGIYIATFGPAAYYETVCDSCGTFTVAQINLSEDVPVKKLERPEDRIFELELKKGKAVVALPNGITQRRLIESAGATTAENLTTIISGCLLSINGSPSMGEVTARSLGMADRSAIVSAIYDRTPGPRLGEVTKACEACGKDYLAPLSLAALFRV